MSDAEKVLHATLRRQWAVQGGLTLAVAGVFFATRGWGAAIAALFGGGITVLNTLLQLWQLRRVETKIGNGAERNMRFLYRCMVERFVATVGLFALGMGGLALPPLALISGFVVGQLPLLFVGLRKDGI